MMAYLGLASAPAEVKRITHVHATLKSNRAYVPGLRMVVDFMNSTLTFGTAAHLRVGRGWWDEDGYALEGKLSPPLRDDELWFLVGD